MSTKTPEQVEREVELLAGRGLLAAGVFLRNRIVEKISVPAPRRRVIAGPRSKVVPPGTPYYVATTKATKGAPPRRVNGWLRSRVMVRQPKPNVVQIGVFHYIPARPLETWMNHAYLLPTMIEQMGALDTIIGNQIKMTRHTPNGGSNQNA